MHYDLVVILYMEGDKMSHKLSEIEPKPVFNFFKAISDIPRGSGNEKEISDYLVCFAVERNLDVIQDKALNIIIKKPGTKGYENAPTVILQGHMDMVCEKNFDTVHDFEKDPIKILIEDDFVKADGTTLGADNGLAVAYALALLDSKDIPHPPLEVIITTDEEVGMNGAIALDTSDLEGKYLINLDSEEEGELLVSCAGGLKASINIPIKWENAIMSDQHTTYKVMIKGLKGGHSGMDIDKNRGNANCLLGRLLYELNNHLEMNLIDIYGGSKDNAIPREAYSNIMINKKYVEQLSKLIIEMEEVFKNEYITSDPNLKIVLTKEDSTIQKYMSKETVDHLIFLLMTLPNGIQTMSSNIEDLVESSLNLGVMQMNEDTIELIFAVRSAVKSLKVLIRNQLKMLADRSNCEFRINSEYPEWEFKKDSKLRDIFVNVYEKMYNKKPLIKALHAGLECGVFAEKMKDVDMISIGPDMFDVHTPDERLSISSTKRTWEYLLEVLKQIK